MIISFYFCFKNLSQRNINKIKLRFERLLIPYIIWPILILFINNILISLGFHTIYNRKFKIYDLILQYIFGRHIHKIFWFQFQILIITLYFSIISFAFPKNYLSILYFSLIISYLLQYSGINFKYFSRYKDSNCRNVGSIVEILPLAVTGIIFGSINIINIMNNFKITCIIISIIIIYFLFEYNIFNDILGFRYPGIKVNMGGIFLFLCFSVLPIEKIKSRNFIRFINCLTRYTGGIYYLHFILFLYLRKKLSVINNSTIYGSIIIYSLNYLLCFIGTKIFHNTKLIYLFN